MGRPLKSALDSSGRTPFGESYLQTEALSLISFAEGSRLATGGFGYLDSNGKVDPAKPLEAWINCRMTQVFGLAELTGLAHGRSYVEHGINGLLDLFVVQVCPADHTVVYSSLGNQRKDPSAQLDFVNPVPLGLVIPA